MVLKGSFSAVAPGSHHSYTMQTSYTMLKLTRKTWRLEFFKMDVLIYRLEISPIRLHCRVDTIFHLAVLWSDLPGCEVVFFGPCTNENTVV